jgi:hypothetical protein
LGIASKIAQVAAVAISANSGGRLKVSDSQTSSAMMNGSG